MFLFCFVFCFVFCLFGFFLIEVPFLPKIHGLSCESSSNEKCVALILQFFEHAGKRSMFKSYKMHNPLMLMLLTFTREFIVD